MAYHFRNLVFEGGGVKGVAYIGALEALEQRGILGQIRRVGGTSAGAITALLVGLNYPLGEIRNILSELDFRKLLDASFGLVRNTERLVSDFGWYKGDFFRTWVGQLIAARAGSPDATFDSLRRRGDFREMYFMGTNLSTRFGEVFSAEHTPRVGLADAVRISISLPLFFACRRSPRGDVYVDGGVLDNYPVKLFDREKYVGPEGRRRTEYYDAHNAELQRAGRAISPYVYNKETLGFRLDSAAEIAAFRDQAEPVHRPIDDFFDYTVALVQTILGVQEDRHLHSDDWQRTVYIDTLGVRATDFTLDAAIKAALVQAGRAGCERYFAWYDNPASAPVNR
jgi:NTE family protein